MLSFYFYFNNSEHFSKPRAILIHTMLKKLDDSLRLPPSREKIFCDNILDILRKSHVEGQICFASRKKQQILRTMQRRYLLYTLIYTYIISIYIHITYYIHTAYIQLYIYIYILYILFFGFIFKHLNLFCF